MRKTAAAVGSSFAGRRLVADALLAWERAQAELAGLVGNADRLRAPFYLKEPS